MSRIKYHTDTCTVCQSQLVEVFTEELAIPLSEVRFGGNNPMHEVSTGVFCRSCGLKYARLPSEVSAWVSTIEGQIEAKRLENELKEVEIVAKYAEIFKPCKKIPSFAELCAGIKLNE